MKANKMPKGCLKKKKDVRVMDYNSIFEKNFEL